MSLIALSPLRVFSLGNRHHWTWPVVQHRLPSSNGPSVPSACCHSLSVVTSLTLETSLRSNDQGPQSSRCYPAPLWMLPCPSFNSTFLGPALVLCPIFSSKTSCSSGFYVTDHHGITRNHITITRRTFSLLTDSAKHSAGYFLFQTSMSICAKTSNRSTLCLFSCTLQLSSYYFRKVS